MQWAEKEPMQNLHLCQNIQAQKSSNEAGNEIVETITVIAVLRSVTSCKVMPIHYKRIENLQVNKVLSLCFTPLMI